MPKLKHERSEATDHNPPTTGTGGAVLRDAGGPGGFTIEEHRRVQREIEQRAYRLWRAHGYAVGGPLDHWLRAESVVLDEFVRSRALADPTRTQTGDSSFPPRTGGHLPRPKFRSTATLRLER